MTRPLWLSPTLTRLAAELEAIQSYGAQLGLTEVEVQQEITAEAARALARPEPFSPHAVRTAMQNRRATGASVGDRVAHELQAIATQVKAGTIHEDHDGWDWKHPDRILRCSCGTALVDPKDAS